jgi:PTS system mannose-specific IIA component
LNVYPGASVIGIIIVTHGLLADGLVNSAEMILGTISHIATVSLDEKMTPETLKSLVEECMENLMEDEGVLILTDLRGATPFNVTASFAERNDVSVITGVNLPLLLEALTQRNNKDLKTLTEHVVREAREGILDVALLIEQHRKSIKQTTDDTFEASEW